MHAPILGAFLLVLAGLVAPSAGADCTCLCMDGAPATVCSTLESARTNTDACAARAPDTCPVDLQWRGGERYPAPADGAVNCREVRVWDATASSHRSVRVCDVQPTA